MAITAADYNNIRQKVIGVLGTGAGGYGQAPVSSAATSTNVISATLWNGLRTDMIKSRQHQTPPYRSVPSYNKSPLALRRCEERHRFPFSQKSLRCIELPVRRFVKAYCWLWIRCCRFTHI